MPREDHGRVRAAGCAARCTLSVLNARHLALTLPAIALAAACGARTGLFADGSPSDSGAVDASSSGAGDSSLDAPASHDASSSSSGSSSGGDAAEASPGPPPSCAPAGPGTGTCGTSPLGCCSTLPVPAGTFFRTYATGDAGPHGEADPATVSALRLDAFEVTVGRFRAFAAAWNAGYRPAAGSGKHTHLHGGQGLANSASPGTFEPGWDPSDEALVAPTDGDLGACGAFSTWTLSPGARDDLPMNCVTWAEAYAFCIWDGGFLPSEAEWEYAAAGGPEQREFPWGEADPGTGSEYAIYGCYYEPPDTQECNVTTPPGFAPVGTPTQGTGIWGQLDQAGNVWEETLDAFTDYVDPCVDCAALVRTLRVVRGGSFISPEIEILPWNRFELDPSVRNNYVGFRCGRGP